MMFNNQRNIRLNQAHLHTKVDLHLNRILVLMSAMVTLLLVTIMLFLFYESWPFIKGLWGDELGAKFTLSQGWYPLEEQFNMMPMILASILVTVCAVLFALPLGLGSAIYLVHFAPPASKQSFRLFLNLLAGVPSVVFGLWGLTRLVPIITQWQPPGTSLLAAALVLALMILPTIALTCASAIAAVPSSILNGAKALGMSRKTCIIHVVLPSARSGIQGGILLAIVRALGETMAVLMVSGNVVQLPSSLFDPVRVLTANIALEMAYAMDYHRASLFFSGLLLTVLVGLVSWTALKTNQIACGKKHG